MKKFVLVLMAIVVTAQSIKAQDEPEQPEKKGFDKSKLFFGGNFGLGFGTNTFVNVSPQVGYRFNDYLAAGAGVNFNYYSYKIYDALGNNARINSGYAGFNVFGRVYPIKFILIQAQPELNYRWASLKSNGSTSEKMPGQFVPSLLIGGGAAIPMGGRNGALLLMMQYDVLQEELSPYGNKPFFTMGYNF